MLVFSRGGKFIHITYFLLAMLPLALSVSWIVPGAVWYDTDGNRIDAHGGQILRVNDTFFWVRQSPMALSSLHQNMLRG